ncbi:hypothetical protein DFP94_10427 [Fontibacillus phaseoli]|uniref:Uncharacterized protein n=1 Tax=Fontibacillus phaseoli TaxID=1416533 RepID=A0A369BG80_9BACL|nr:hypothetical protein [Fontibacillus phaseoli]RCX19576.1 hypothetical protein DFP94_10427 [Fontibacillus phaseoli]
MKISVRTITASLVAVFLAFFMVLSLPILSSLPETPENMEREAYKIEETTRKQNVTLRLNSSHQGKLFIDRDPLPILAATMSAILLLATPRISFRPFFYLFIKRILLMPIKFTSMFVA